jgi:hypothetical protein
MFSITLHKAWLPSVRAGLGTLQAHDQASRRFTLKSHYWLPSRAAWIDFWTNRQWLPRTGKARAATVDLVSSPTEG